MNSTNNSNGQPKQDNIGFTHVMPEIADNHTADNAVAVTQDFADTWLA
jgi:hypothetical protein